LKTYQLEIAKNNNSEGKYTACIKYKPYISICRAIAAGITATDARNVRIFHAIFEIR